MRAVGERLVRDLLAPRNAPHLGGMKFFRVPTRVGKRLSRSKKSEARVPHSPRPFHSFSSPRLGFSLHTSTHTDTSFQLSSQAKGAHTRRMERQRSLIREARFAASRPRRLSEVGQTPSSAPDRDLVASQETEFIGSVPTPPLPSTIERGEASGGGHFTR